MPSIILDDFFGDTKIELQLAHKASVDDKNLDMIDKVFWEIKKLKKENEKLKKERDFFECEFHKTLEHQANDCEQYEKQVENLKKEDPIHDCLNDIINQVETREWNRVNEHRDRLVKKMRKQSEKVKSMKDDWEVATQKIAQQNSDLHNEIKRLKQTHRPLPKGWHMVEAKASLKVSRDLMKVSEEKCNLTKEVEKLKFNLKRAEDALDEQMEKNEDLMEKLTEGDDELDECFCCGKRFDSHEARYNMGESLRLKYQRYYGSENDDGDICPACIIPKIIDK